MSIEMKKILRVLGGLVVVGLIYTIIFLNGRLGEEVQTHISMNGKSVGASIQLIMAENRVKTLKYYDGEIEKSYKAALGKLVAGPEDSSAILDELQQTVDRLSTKRDALVETNTPKHKVSFPLRPLR